MRFVRAAMALVAAAAILMFAGWLDGQVFRDIERRQSVEFSITLITWALPFGYLAVAAGVLAVVILAWWARSILVGIAYAVVGAFFGFLVTINWQFAAEINGAPSVLPQPLATIVGRIWFWGAEGPLNALSTIGAGMLLAGLAIIALAARRRFGSRSQAGRPAITEPSA